MKLEELLSKASKINKATFKNKIKRWNLNSKSRGYTVVENDISPIDAVMLENTLTDEDREVLKSSFKIKGSVASEAYLPTEAEPGDSYIVGTDTKDIYFCVGKSDDGSPIWKSDPEIEDVTRIIEEKLAPINEKIETKVDKVDGKQLSTEDYTTDEKTKLSGIAEGAEKNVQSNWTSTSTSDASYIQNKPSIKSGTGSDSVIIGGSGTASGQQALAEGMSTTASGYYSHAEGASTTASKTGAHAEGQRSTAAGAAAHAEGYNTTANEMYTHTEGNYTSATYEGAHAEGYYTSSSGQYSHTEGGQTNASGKYSHAEGYTSIASGQYSHAEGEQKTKASGKTSHAEGYATQASGNYSHSEGAYTTASGEASHAENNTTTSSGMYSHAEGYYTTANHKSQHVFGENNILDSSTTTATTRGNYVEIVGNGISSAKRSNARTLDWNGNETIAGDLIFNGSTSLTNLIPSTTTSENQLVDKSQMTTAIAESLTDYVSSVEGMTFPFLHSTELFGANTLEVGPWYKNKTQADGTNVKIEKGDWAIVLMDESVCYATSHGFRYQRMKDGGLTDYGFVVLPNNTTALIKMSVYKEKLVFFFVDNSKSLVTDKEIVYIISDTTNLVNSIKEYQTEADVYSAWNNIDHEGSTRYNPNDAEKAFLETTMGFTTDPVAEETLYFPTARYVCSVSQTEESAPVWGFNTIMNDTSLTAAQILALNSGATEDLIKQITTNKNDISTNAGNIASNTSEINNQSQKISDIETNLTKKQDALSESQLIATKSGITEEKVVKLNNIEDGAEVNVQADWNQNDDTQDDYIKNRIAYYSDKTILSLQDAAVTESSGTYSIDASSLNNDTGVGFNNYERFFLVVNDVIYQGTKFEASQYGASIQFSEFTLVLTTLVLRTSTIELGETANVRIYVSKAPTVLNDDLIPDTVARLTYVDTQLESKKDIEVYSEVSKLPSVLTKNTFYNATTAYTSYWKATLEDSDDKSLEYNGRFISNSTFTPEVTGVTFYGNVPTESGYTYEYSIKAGVGVLLKLE